MSEPKIYATLTELFRDIFEDDAIQLSAETTAGDVEGWDSLSNIRMILAVETAFGIRLSAAQVASFSRLGDLVALIVTKTCVHGAG